MLTISLSVLLYAAGAGGFGAMAYTDWRERRVNAWTWALAAIAMLLVALVAAHTVALYSALDRI